MKYLLCLSLLFLTACDSTGMSYLSDKELRQRHAKCRMSAGLSAPEIQVCKNLKRECENRARDGNYAC
ncbi:MAG: hypothetical protein MK185_07230 [Saccharospirillaceae bacterium]|nr:hypothetical protein A3759_12455 [Thalassolituus sp. HI0120]KZZ45880.1 hypothetical protein A3759_19285 [Thalassolituus sp. HI0120]MCH2040407.1 hypothetical protein [Saccharospirillaceae bacterium]